MLLYSNECREICVRSFLEGGLDIVLDVWIIVLFEPAGELLDQ